MNREEDFNVRGPLGLKEFSVPVNLATWSWLARLGKECHPASEQLLRSFRRRSGAMRMRVSDLAARARAICCTPTSNASSGCVPAGVVESDTSVTYRTSYPSNA